ncbi:MAG: S9 family peptidase, partial [Bacteroidetes bacterium]|nr:S9 family peptidase [Bacteroidota bacterium]
MKNRYILYLFISMMAMNACKQESSIKYPVTRKVDTVDHYFGTEVADPYRWLENDTSEETAEWVGAQNQVTNDYLSEIPFRQKIRERLTLMWNYPRYGVPFKEGPYYFFFKNDGLQNQSVFYVKRDPDGVARVLLDPNKFSEDGTIALAGTAVSHDGKYLAYSIARSGSDWNEVYVMDIESGRQLPDTLKWVKFSGMSWQNNGFYYSRYDAPKKGMELSKKNEFQKVYYHVAGTSQQEDKLVYTNMKYPLRNYGASVTEDQRFLILYESESTSGTAIYCRDLGKPG